MTDKKKQKRQFWVILTIVFIGFLGISMPYLIFPALFLNPAYSILPDGWGPSSHALFLGITLAAYPLGQFIGSPILGALSDDYGRKGLLSVSLVLTGFFNLLTGFAIEGHLLWLLIVSRFAAGLMEGNVAIARAMAVDLKTISKHNSFGKINAATSIAYLIGPLLGGLMTDKSLWEDLTTATPFYVVCILFLCLAALSAGVLEKKEIITSAKIRTFWERINFVKRLFVLFLNKRLQFFMLISTAFTLARELQNSSGAKCALFSLDSDFSQSAYGQ
jgi:MFS family permease